MSGVLTVQAGVYNIDRLTCEWGSDGAGRGV